MDQCEKICCKNLRKNRTRRIMGLSRKHAYLKHYFKGFQKNLQENSYEMSNSVFQELKYGT